MSQWNATTARKVLAALLRIGWRVKRQSAGHASSPGRDEQRALTRGLHLLHHPVVVSMRRYLPADPRHPLRHAAWAFPLLALLASCSDAPQDGTPTWGDPIELGPEQLGQWEWVSMPEMRCSDGSPGGFAVNFTDASRDLVIYLQGGGICYDAVSCAVSGAASSVGDDPLYTALDPSIRDQRGMFDRTNPSNPLRGSNFVVVPHCTGDHHTGHRVSEYGGDSYHHVGYTNVTRMLERVVPTFSDAHQVVLAGFSAGGVGIAANYHQIASAFASMGHPPAHLVVDAGPFLRPPYLLEAPQQLLRERWGLDDTIGRFCPRCLTHGFHEAYYRNAELHPGVRASLVCTYEDSVVRLLYTLLNGTPFTPDQMRDGLHDLADWMDTVASSMDPSQFEVFYYEGDGHGALHVDGLFAIDGLVDFLNAQVGTGPWSSSRP
jgi:hypothetical protein